MKGLDERIAELIQLDVDGELDEAGREELQPILAQSETARQFQQEMQRVAGLMNQAPELDPPASLHHRILSSIDLPAKEGLMEWAADWFRPVSYGLAVAAGVLLAVGIDQLGPEDPADMGNLVGSMVNSSGRLAVEPAGVLTIREQQLQGSINLKPLGEAWAIEFDLQTSREVEVSINLESAGLGFGGVADPDSRIDLLEVSGGTVRVMNQGSHPFVLFVRGKARQDGRPHEIGISVSQAGQMIYQGTLKSGV